MPKQDPTQPFFKLHEGKQIAFADNLLQAHNALNRNLKEKLTDEQEQGLRDDGHLLFFGVDEWKSGDVGALNKALQSGHNTFKRIELFGCDINNDAQINLAKGFHGDGLKGVTQFDLDNVKLTERGAKAILTEAAECATIETLNLQGSLSSDLVVKGVAEGLAPQTNIFKSLKKLDLRINSIDEKGAAHVADIMTRIEVQDNECEVDLFYNELKAGGAGHIAAALNSGRCNVVTLDLCCNKIGDAGAKSIAEAMRMNISLKTLKLALNGITAVGMIDLLQMFFPVGDKTSVNEVLETLDMSANVAVEQVTFDVGELNQKMAKSQKIAELEAKQEAMNATDDYGEGYAEVTEELANLRLADTANNEGRPLVAALINVIANCTTLQNLDFTGIELDPAGWDRLGDVLKQSSNNMIRNNLEMAPMNIKFSIVDLMDIERLKNLENKIWVSQDRAKNYMHLDWRRRVDDEPLPDPKQ